MLSTLFSMFYAQSLVIYLLAIHIIGTLSQLIYCVKQNRLFISASGMVHLPTFHGGFAQRT